MLNRLLPKACLLLLLLHIHTFSNARQLHTIADGDWFDPSVWYNQLTPSSTYDTVEVQHHLTMSAYLVLAENDVLTIDSGASLCSTDTFEFYDNAQLYVYGYLTAGFININGAYNYEYVGDNGYVDVGGGGISESGGSLVVDGGCLDVQYGTPKCNPACVYDSSIFLHYNGLLVTFEVDSNAIDGAYEYFFGDGDSAINTTYYQVHNYVSPGAYNAMVVLQVCCNTDTLYTTVNVTSLTAGLLPIDWCNTSGPLLKGPMPLGDELHISHTFCEDMKGTIQLYSITGAMLYSTPFSTTGAMLDVRIPLDKFASGCYVLNIETETESFRTKVIVAR